APDRLDDRGVEIVILAHCDTSCDHNSACVSIRVIAAAYSRPCTLSPCVSMQAARNSSSVPKKQPARIITPASVRYALSSAQREPIGPSCNTGRLPIRAWPSLIRAPARLAPARLEPARLASTRLTPARLEPARLEPARSA